MKFLKAEYDDIQDLLKTLNIDTDLISFKKKGGNLHILHNDGIIRYHRKTETGLSNKGQWIKSTVFSLKVNDAPWQTHDSWQGVLYELEKAFSVR